MHKLLNKTRTKLIGDPHIGREFVDGVPLDRRGEREESQLVDLTKAVNTPEIDMNVMMGDIFDKFIVKNTDLYEVFMIYATAADAHPETDFILLRGNHDVSRNTEIKSSFDILAKMLAPFTNVYVIEELTLFSSRQGDEFMFCPYDAFKSTVDMIGDKFNGDPEEIPSIVAAFGHWDIESFGGSDHNLIPTGALAAFTKTVFTGHIHTPSSFTRDGVLVEVTGSMQPYAHGEDAAGDVYITADLATVRANLSADSAFYRNKCLRIVAPAGEEIPPGIDCLQLKTTSTTNNNGDDQVLTVTMDNFSFESVFREHFTGLGFAPGAIDQCWARYQEVENNVQDA